MFVSPFSEKPSCSGRVGVKQVGHEAGHSQAFRGAGPPPPASSQLQLLPKVGEGGPSTQTPPPHCSESPKKKREGRASKELQGSGLAEAEQGLGTLVVQGLPHYLGWAGTPPLAKCLSIPQRLAMAHPRTGDQATPPIPVLTYLAIPTSILCTLGGRLCQNLHSAVLSWE